jgi:hypothetical protein
MASEDTLQHHPYGASGAAGWMTCHGKLAMEADKPDKSSPDADRGSAAHYLAALCLINGRNPSDYEYKGVVCWEKPGERDGQVLFGDVLPEGAVGRSVWKIDQKMVDDVTGYVEDVRRRAKGGELLVEERVEFGTAIGLPGAFGTADAVILSADGTELIIEDYKNGFTEVVAERNPQLMLYALGVLGKKESSTVGSDFDDFLIEDGIFEEVPVEAVKKVDKAKTAKAKKVETKVVAPSVKSEYLESKGFERYEIDEIYARVNAGENPVAAGNIHGWAIGRFGRDKMKGIPETEFNNTVCGTQEIDLDEFELEDL